MTEYEKVLTLQEDFRIELLSFTGAYRGMQEITKAIKQRQAAAQAATEARRAELAGIADDQSRPASVRKLAAAELDTLPEYREEITAAEAAAFAEERTAAETALHDLRQTVEEIKAAVTAAKAELDQIRGQTAGKADFQLWEKWLAGAAKDYEAL